MLFMPVSKGIRTLSDAELRSDLESVRKTGSCALGRQAAYFSSPVPGRKYYLAYGDIHRIFKRIAMTKGGFTGKGVFGSLPYLAAVLTDGSERQFRVDTEAEADEFLREFHKLCPDVPLLSKSSEEKLAVREASAPQKVLPGLSPEAAAELALLEKAKGWLEMEPSVPAGLSRAAAAKRSSDLMNPFYRYLAVCMLAGGILCCAGGAAAMQKGAGTGIYFLMIGAALLLFSLSSRLLPAGRSSPRHADALWQKALASSRDLLDTYGGSFPLPPQYAHPAALTRMIRSIREGRAQNAAEAAELLKADLKAATSDVTVSQEEYDEITAIKPMYLLCGYSDTL